jgi:RNA polymerase sigma factor (sigma-70 family)
MTDNTNISHLFRTEFSKITAVLAKQFGLAHLETAEDIAGETFLAALESWPYKGLPANPTAWLYAVAKNKAASHINRAQLFDQKIVPEISREHSGNNNVEWSEPAIFDSQLQMIFAVCHPSISAESQIGLALRVLCGFSPEEIATAFFSTKDTISKRIYRAKEKLREEKVELVFPGKDEINNRLDNVLKVIYLLFSEGYYSESNDAVLREELCAEAMRLALLLLKHDDTNKPKVNALMALMCFHASRFPARKNHAGEIILYADQNTDLWNRELISKGATYLKAASQGPQLSTYHLEGGIAWWHTVHNDSTEKWQNILQLYNHLLQIEYSQVAALNRTYALAKVKGTDTAICEAEKLKLHNNLYYHILLGELYREKDQIKSRTFFETALRLAKTNTEKNMLSKILNANT